MVPHFKKGGIILSLFFYSILLLFLFMLSRFDIKHHRIPDFFLYEYLLLFLFGQYLSLPLFHVSFLSRLLGVTLLPFVLLVFTLFFPGGIGGGDVKFLALTGGFFGFWFQIYAFFFALLGALLYFLLTNSTASRLFPKRKDLKAVIALGPFLSFGILFQILLQNIFNVL